MPHFPKPFYRKPRKLWYVQIDGVQYNLGPDETAAFDAYHQLMRKPKAKRTVRKDAVAALIDKFLEHVEKNLSEDTYVWYQSRLQCFVTLYPDLLLEDMKPFHVQEWIDDMDVSPGTKRNYARSIQRCLAWCEEMGHIERSPIAKFKKPAGGKRERIVTPAEYETILANVPNENFRDLLVITWETGCRPQESLIVESRHVQLDRCRWFIPKDEAKGRKHDRVVYLNDRAVEITRRLMLAHPEGPLFRNTTGRAWTTDAVNCAFVQLQTRMGLQKLNGPRCKKVRVPKEKRAERKLEVAARKKDRESRARKLADKFCLYHLRHTWMNRLLTIGVDSLTVAVLAGHVDPSTLATTYQHLSQNSAFLLSEAKRAG